MTQTTAPSVFGNPATYTVDVPDYRVLEIAITLLNVFGWIQIVVGTLWFPCVALFEPTIVGGRLAIVFYWALSLIAGAFGYWVMAQVLACVRDMARNSFYMRRGLTVLAGLTNKP